MSPEMKNGLKAVEMGIFAIVSLIFLNSAYNLFMDGKFSSGGDRQPLERGTLMTQASVSAPQPRQNASAVKSAAPISGFVPYETKCQIDGEVFETNAAKVRILGPFCGAAGRQLAAEGSGGPAAQRPDNLLSDYRIENTTSRYVATIFGDHATGKFSTDFIPLEMGRNKVMMEFKYRSGRVVPVELTIIRK